MLAEKVLRPSHDPQAVVGHSAHGRADAEPESARADAYDLRTSWLARQFRGGQYLFGVENDRDPGEGGFREPAGEGREQPAQCRQGS